MRKELSPALLHAYQDWVDNNDPGGLKNAVREGHQHWLSIARKILELRRVRGAQTSPQLEALIEDSHL